jgi:hypothetical protein
MNIKSLLIGSAAALAVVSGAQAADAIVAAEPEPMEYVRVCDAFGAGYFYIPGGETCLKIGGQVRFQVEFGEDVYTPTTPDQDWDMMTRAAVNFTAKSDTELGALTSYIQIVGEYSYDDANAFFVDEAYLSLSGLKAGYFNSYFDAGIAGETDNLASQAKFVSIGYEYVVDAFKVGLFLDEIEPSMVKGTATYHGVGFQGQASATLGGVSLYLLGGYDVEAEDGVVRGIATAAIGPGTLGVGGFWSSGVNVYGNEYEWAVAASYALKVSDKLTITPGYQYSANARAGAVFGGTDDWKAGFLLDYVVVTGLNAKLNLQYTDSTESVGGWFRLERSF